MTTRNEIDHAAGRIDALADTARRHIDTGIQPLTVIGELLSELTTLVGDMRIPGRMAWCPLCADDTLIPTTPAA